MGWGFHTKINGDGSSHNTVYDRETNERHSWDNDGKGNITKDHHTDQNTDKKQNTKTVIALIIREPAITLIQYNKSFTEVSPVRWKIISPKYQGRKIACNHHELRRTIS